MDTEVEVVTITRNDAIEIAAFLDAVVSAAADYEPDLLTVTRERIVRLKKVLV